VASAISAGLRPAWENRAPSTRIEGGTMNDMFGPREVLEEAADRWWLFLVTGIAWLVFALLVFQWDYTTVYAISILFGYTLSSACCSSWSGSMPSGTRMTRSRRSPRSSASSC
jgi:hypothetical protein